MNITISQKDNESSGIFKAKNDEGRIVGQMSYVWAGDDKIIIDHTEVASAYEGMGIGNDMVSQAVDFARSSNIKILPMCPFAKAVFAKHPDFNDVRSLY